MLFSLYDGDRASFYAALGVLALSIIRVYGYLEQFDLVDPWIVLAVLGVTVIFISSILETRREQLLAWSARLSEKLDRKSQVIEAEALVS